MENLERVNNVLASFVTVITMLAADYYKNIDDKELKEAMDKTVGGLLKDFTNKDDLLAMMTAFAADLGTDNYKLLYICVTTCMAINKLWDAEQIISGVKDAPEV